MDKVIIDGVDVSECEYANACDKKLKCVILQDDVCETKPYCEGYNCYYKQLMRARAEIEDIKTEYEVFKNIASAECKRARAELKKYEDMAKKGLDEFKDVGGCWGCSLQLQLNQDIEDIKQLKAENKQLKEEMCSNCDFQKQYFAETKNLLDENKKLRNKICKERAETREDFEKIKQALQEIREIAEKMYNTNDEDVERDLYIKLQDKINEVIGAEE